MKIKRGIFVIVSLIVSAVARGPILSFGEDGLNKLHGYDTPSIIADGILPRQDDSSNFVSASSIDPISVIVVSQIYGPETLTFTGIPTVTSAESTASSTEILSTISSQSLISSGISSEAGSQSTVTSTNNLLLSVSEVEEADMEPVIKTTVIPQTTTSQPSSSSVTDVSSIIPTVVWTSQNATIGTATTFISPFETESSSITLISTSQPPSSDTPTIPSLNVAPESTTSSVLDDSPEGDITIIEASSTTTILSTLTLIPIPLSEFTKSNTGVSSISTSTAKIPALSQVIESSTSITLTASSSDIAQVNTTELPLPISVTSQDTQLPTTTLTVIPPPLSSTVSENPIPELTTTIRETITITLGPEITAFTTSTGIITVKPISISSIIKDLEEVEVSIITTSTVVIVDDISVLTSTVSETTSLGENTKSVDTQTASTASLISSSTSTFQETSSLSTVLSPSTLSTVSTNSLITLIHSDNTDTNTKTPPHAPPPPPSTTQLPSSSPSPSTAITIIPTTLIPIPMHLSLDPNLNSSTLATFTTTYSQNFTNTFTNAFESEAESPTILPTTSAETVMEVVTRSQTGSEVAEATASASESGRVLTNGAGGGMGNFMPGGRGGAGGLWALYGSVVLGAWFMVGM